MVNNLSERVIKAREDGEEALRIIRDFEPLIKKCIGMYIKDTCRYEDAMQEGRLTVLGCIKNYDTSSKVGFEGYVKMGVIYSIRNFSLKYKETISLDEEISEEGVSLHEIIDIGIDVEEDVIREEQLKALASALDKLTGEQRRVIEEFYFEGKTMREISGGRRCHYMTVVRKKERALEKLREIMKEAK